MKIELIEIECSQCKKKFLKLNSEDGTSPSLCEFCEKIGEAGREQNLRENLDAISLLYGDLAAKSKGRIKNFKIEEN